MVDLNNKAVAEYNELLESDEELNAFLADLSGIYIFAHFPNPDFFLIFHISVHGFNGFNIPFRHCAAGLQLRERIFLYMGKRRKSSLDRGLGDRLEDMREWVSDHTKIVMPIVLLICVLVTVDYNYFQSDVMHPAGIEPALKASEASVLSISSSVHEVILLPDDGTRKAEDLWEMVCEINATQVEPDCGAWQ